MTSKARPNVCESCGAPRRNRKWPLYPVRGGGEGYVCPDCPTPGEGIKRQTARGRVRFAAITDGTPGPDGKRRQLRRRFDTLDAARAWIADTKAGVEAAGDGPYIDESGMTVTEACERWFAMHEAKVGTPTGIRLVTLNGYRSSVATLLTLIGDVPIRDLTQRRINEALETLSVQPVGKWNRPMSHRSVSYALGTLRQVLTYAVDQEWIKGNPAAHARAPREQYRGGTEGERRWTRDELMAFRDRADRDRAAWARAGMRLTLCGLRLSEVLGLDWRSVDLSEGTVTVEASRVRTGRGTETRIGPPKTRRSRRTIRVDTFHEGTTALLRALWDEQGRPETGLVVRGADGQPVAHGAFSERFKAISKAAGVPVLESIHNVRHSIGTGLHEAGVSDNRAAAMLGHDVKTFQAFYVLGDESAVDEGVEAAGAMFAKAG